VVKRLHPAGILLASSGISALGIYTMSIATGGMVYVAAILFAIGVMYFWPTMIGYVAEYIPQTGALGMSLLGGAGMFAVSMWNPVIGGWIDGARAVAQEQNLSPQAAELAAGQATLANLSIFPMVLVLAFALLLFFTRKQKNTVAQTV
jgi:MFS family permease